MGTLLGQSRRESSPNKGGLGEFTRHVLTLMSGTTLAQMVPLLVLPLLSRLYSPEAFGAYALFVATTTLLAVLVTARYELAIMLPGEDKDAVNLVVLALVLAGSSMLVLFTVVGVCREFMVFSFAGNMRISWFFILVASILMNVVYQVLSYWVNRKKRYGLLASAVIAQQLSAAFARVFLGYNQFEFLGNGLILGTLAGQAFSVALMLRGNAVELWTLRSAVHLRELYRIAKQYRQFPVYNAPYSILGTISRDYLIYGLTFFGHQHAAGLFSLARSIVSAPVTFLSASLGQVFFQKAATTFGTPELEQITTQLMTILSRAFLPAFVLFAMWAPQGFALVFGEEWREAGLYGSLYAPAAFLFLFSSWPERIYEVAGKQQFSLLVQVVSDSVTILSVGGLLYLGLDSFHVVWVYSLLSSVYHAAYVVTLFAIARFQTRFFTCLIGEAIAKAALWMVLFYGLAWVLSPLLAFAAGVIVLVGYYCRCGVEFFRSIRGGLPNAA